MTAHASRARANLGPRSTVSGTLPERARIAPLCVLAAVITMTACTTSDVTGAGAGGGGAVGGVDAPELVGIDPANDGWKQHEPAPVPSACAGSDQHLRRAGRLYDVASQAVHELVTCGGMQVAVSSSLMVAIIKSNPDLVTPDLAAQLGATPGDQLKHDGQGNWSMDIPSFPGSTFTMRFYEASGGGAITSDLFRLESYMAEVEVSHDLTAAEMVADPTKKATYRFKWSKLGPLAHLLNNGKALPNPVVLQLNAIDLLQLKKLNIAPEKLGAFGSLLDLRVDSRTLLVESDDGAAVSFAIDAVRRPLGDIARSGSFDLGQLRIKASDGVLDGAVVGQSLGYNSEGLTGHLDLTWSGGGFAATARADFGDGRKYEKTTWGCL